MTAVHVSWRFYNIAKSDNFSNYDAREMRMGVIYLERKSTKMGWLCGDILIFSTQDGFFFGTKPFDGV